MMRRFVIAASLFASLAFAEDKKEEPKKEEPAAPAGPVGPPPKADVIREVVDYLENGKDRGPALLDIVPCLKVDNTRGSPTQFQCVDPVKAAVPKNTTVFAWLQWYCPKDGKYEDVQIQFIHEGTVRQTIDGCLDAGLGCGGAHQVEVAALLETSEADVVGCREEEPRESLASLLGRQMKEIREFTFKIFDNNA
jgi:hypothetical protein